jgi:hypothetical protein
MLILNLPRPLVLKFSGAFFALDRVPHPTTRDKETGDAVIVDNPLKRFSGQEMHLHQGINTVVDELRFDPRIQRFIVDPQSAEAQPMAPSPPKIPTESVAQPAVAVAQQKANTK